MEEYVRVCVCRGGRGGRERGRGGRERYTERKRWERGGGGCVRVKAGNTDVEEESKKKV